MAEGSTVTKDETPLEEFHEIECDNEMPTKLALLLKITQPGNCPLPIGVITERSVMALVKNVTNYTPLGVTVMNDIDTVVEFGSGVRMYEVAKAMFTVNTWDKYKVEMGTLMSTRSQIVGMVQEREQVRQAAVRVGKQREEMLLREEQHRSDIQDLLDRFEQQVQRIEKTSSRVSSFSESRPHSPGTVDTPVIIRKEDVLNSERKFFRSPSLPRFSGLVPVPKGEGSYEQYMFQVRGFRSTYTEEAIKSGIIGSITDDARDYLDFIGFDKDLIVFIEALDRRYGKGQTTDRLQQDFFQLFQERKEQIQQFTGCFEFRYKKLIALHPDRYNECILKEHLFYGMTQHLRDSMRYLYKQVETTYEELMSSAKEAESEWLENKQIRAKLSSVVDPGKKERDELKAKIDKLSAELSKKEKECNFKSYKPKRTPTSSPKSSPRQDTGRDLKGPCTSAAGPFCDKRPPVQCYKCGGWGHFQKNCVTQGNVNWEELNWIEPHPEVIDPVCQSSGTQ